MIYYSGDIRERFNLTRYEHMVIAKLMNIEKDSANLYMWREDQVERLEKVLSIMKDE